MTIIQLAAARCAGVRVVVYHTFNKDQSKFYRMGKKWLDEYEESHDKNLETKKFLKDIANVGFRWGFSDGN